MSRTLLLLPLVALILQAQVHVPQLGAVRCADGSVRPVFGVAAAFVLGKPLFPHAVSVSFSEKGGIVATGSNLLLLDSSGNVIASASAPDSGTIVNIESDTDSAVAWLPHSSVVLTWNGSEFQAVAVASFPAGAVTALRRDGSHVHLLVSEESGVMADVEMSIASGYVDSISVLPDASGFVFSAGSATLYERAPGEIEVQTPEGTHPVEIPGATGVVLERMTDDWVHITASNTTRSWALHLTNAGLPELYELPGLPVLKAVAK